MRSAASQSEAEIVERARTNTGTERQQLKHFVEPSVITTVKAPGDRVRGYQRPPESMALEIKPLLRENLDKAELLDLSTDESRSSIPI